MKSTTKKIGMLFMLSAMLLLSSCLKSSQGSWAGDGEYSYIAIDEATSTIYARTISGYFITNEKIKTFSPGTIVFLSYQIDLDNEAERTMIGDNNNVTVYHATLAGEPDVVAEQSTIHLMEAPEMPIVYFENIFSPLFASNIYFGDRWLFPYQAKVKKGENLKVSFYKADVDDTTSLTSDYVIIDIRLTKEGEAEEGAEEKVVEDYVVVNFTQLRAELNMMFGDKDKVNLKFRFYREANEDKLVTLKDSYALQLR